MQTSWQTIKTRSLSKLLPIQFLEENSRYIIELVEGSFAIFSYVEKTTPRNADQIDFEDNFKANSNQKIITRQSDVIETLGNTLLITVGTTPVVAKVGLSNQYGRKSLVVENKGNLDIFWSFESNVTPATGHTIFKKQIWTWNISEEVDIYLVCSGTNSNILVSEGS